MVFRKVPGAIVKARASYQLQRGVPRDCQSQVGKKKWKEPGLWLAQDGETPNPGKIMAVKEMLEL